MPNGHPAFRPFLRRLLQRSVLNAEEQQAILSLNGREVEIEPHRDIVRPGEVTDFSCLVASGMAARFGQLRDGQRQITAIHVPGDMCDLYSLMLPKVEWALQALSARLTVVKVAHRDLLELVRTYPAIAEAFWRDTTADGSIVAQWVVSVGRRDARMRTAHLFCEIGVRLERAGLGQRSKFDLPAIQSQLADALGMTPVHMNRVIRGLRQDGLLILKGREVEIPDWDALAATGQFDGGYLEMDMPPLARL